MTGVRQVSPDRWRATIVIKGKKRHIGYYDTQDEAVEAHRRERELNPFTTGRPYRENALSNEKVAEVWARHEDPEYYNGFRRNPFGSRVGLAEFAETLGIPALESNIQL